MDEHINLFFGTLSLSQNNLAWIYVAYGLYYTTMFVLPWCILNLCQFSFFRNIFFTCTYGMIQ